jgi:hypothetical protein
VAAAGTLEGARSLLVLCSRSASEDHYMTSWMSKVTPAVVDLSQPASWKRDKVREGGPGRGDGAAHAFISALLSHVRLTQFHPCTALTVIHSDGCPSLPQRAPLYALGLMSAFVTRGGVVGGAAVLRSHFRHVPPSLKAPLAREALKRHIAGSSMVVDIVLERGTGGKVWPAVFAG